MYKDPIFYVKKHSLLIYTARTMLWAFLLPQKQGGGDYENERCWDAIIYLVGI